MTAEITEAADALSKAGSLLITAGAGIGVDSGLPDFRGAEGFWRAYPALKAQRVQFQEIANPAAFARDPAMAWAFYGHRRELYQNTTPHAGYRHLLAWGKAMRGGCFVFTSNVDGQFQKAGFGESSLLECHGTIHQLQCTVPCSTQIWAADLDLTIDLDALRVTSPLPSCPRCGAVARPNILMFGDWDWIPARYEAQLDSYQQWLDSRSELATVIIEIGAGTGVPTVRLESERIARQPRTTLIRINPREAGGPLDVISIALPALEAIERIAAALPKSA